ncbi:helix-turn-helix transcriptional regulator [Thioclava sp. BHET1]|nr:helix-turn-helix transcriptional regulator [Thioclava sp. BHET1]
MSHIATNTSTAQNAFRHHYSHTNRCGALYKAPMALRIKELRVEKGWTQDTLAAKAGMSRSQLAMIEKESRPANTLRLNAIASALGVATEDLFETDERERRIIRILRSLNEENADALLRVAEAFSSQKPD